MMKFLDNVNYDVNWFCSRKLVLILLPITRSSTQPMITSLFKHLLHCLTLCSPDVAVLQPDKKSVIMYVTSLFQVFPQSVSMEAIKEVETLPRPGTVASISRTTAEEHYQIQTQQRFSQQVRHTHTDTQVTHLIMGFKLYITVCEN